LTYGNGPVSGTWIDKAHWAERSERERLESALSSHFNGQARFKKTGLFEIARNNPVRVAQRIEKLRVFIFCKRAVEVISVALFPARSAEGDRPVD
jgi:hypothetical protein